MTKLPHDLQVRPGVMSVGAHCIKSLVKTSATTVLGGSILRIITMEKVQCLSHQKIADHRWSKVMTRTRKYRFKERMTTSMHLRGFGHLHLQATVQGGMERRQ